MMNKQVVAMIGYLEDITDAIEAMQTDIAAIKVSQATIATNTTPAETSANETST